MDLPNNLNLLFSDTLVPDVFLNEYLPLLSANQVKVYLYIVFLVGKSRKVLSKDLVSKLGFSHEEVSKFLTELEAAGLIKNKVGRITLIDIKEREIMKHFMIKQDISTQVEDNADKNRSKIKTVEEINKKFFQGIMSTTFLNAVYCWYEDFSFDDEVMFALFQFCYDRGKMNVPYVSAVAESWNREGIKTGLELDDYSMQRRKLQDVSTKIRRNLKIFNAFTESQEKLVDKWVNVYKFDYEIIREALKRSSNTLNAGLDYYDKILTEWYNQNLTDVNQVIEYEKKLKQNGYPASRKKANQKDGHFSSETRRSLDRRGYDEEYVKNLYEN